MLLPFYFYAVANPLNPARLDKVKAVAKCAEVKQYCMNDLIEAVCAPGTLH